MQSLTSRPRSRISIFIALVLLLTLGLQTPAADAVDDYPFRNATPCGNGTWCINGRWYSDWGFAYRNCTDWVTWRMRNTNGVNFYNTMGGGQWGNANNWDDNARRLGYAVNNTPARGAIAQTDAGGWGHVAWVESVNANGTVTIEEYNYGTAGSYNRRTVATGSFVYIHVRDLPTNRAPRGFFDGASGGVGTVNVRGWAIDEDVLASPIGIHVYVGGPSGTGEGHDIGLANVRRDDVAAAVPGAGPYHGFDTTFNTNKRGAQDVYVYALDNMGTMNQLLGVRRVTISDFTIVTAPMPTRVDPCGVLQDRVVIPAVTGVDYFVNGTMASGNYPTRGLETITVTARARTGYRLTGSSSWVFTFDTLLPCSRFSDVPAGSQFASAIYWLTNRGITTGYADGRFGYGDPVLREQMALFLYRAAGSPPVANLATCHTFADVPTGSQFSAAICWLKQRGISTGYSSTEFGYGDAVLREQMAAFMYRAAGSPAVNGLATCHAFADVPAGSEFNPAICWLKQQGITTGYSSTEFGYGDVVLREQMAAFIYRWKDGTPMPVQGAAASESTPIEVAPAGVEVEPIDAPPPAEPEPIVPLPDPPQPVIPEPMPGTLDTPSTADSSESTDGASPAENAPPAETVEAPTPADEDA